MTNALGVVFLLIFLAVVLSAPTSAAATDTRVGNPSSSLGAVADEFAGEIAHVSVDQPSPAAVPQAAEITTSSATSASSTTSSTSSAATNDARQPPAWLSEGAPAPNKSTQPIAAMLRLSFGLIVVVALIAGLAWATKKWMPKRFLVPTSDAQQRLQVLESVSLGMKRQVTLLECGEHWILVGASEQGLTSLATLPRGSGDDQPTREEREDFAAQLRHADQQHDFPQVEGAAQANVQGRVNVPEQHTASPERQAQVDHQARHHNQVQPVRPIDSPTVPKRAQLC
jgi:flagellar protein FliO/FliZ